MGNSVNFRNSDRVTAHVDYVESIDSAVCGKHTVLTLDHVFGRIKSLSVYRFISMLTGKFFHKHFILPQEVACLFQQGRIAVAKCACEVFSVE